MYSFPLTEWALLTFYIHCHICKFYAKQKQNSIITTDAYIWARKSEWVSVRMRKTSFSMLKLLMHIILNHHKFWDILNTYECVYVWRISSTFSFRRSFSLLVQKFILRFILLYLYVCAAYTWVPSPHGIKMMILMMIVKAENKMKKWGLKYR